MDMYEFSDDVFDTLSFSDLMIYTDRSCSYKEDQNYENSFSSFTFKVEIIGSPLHRENTIVGKSISVQENNLKPHQKSQKPLKMKTCNSVKEDGTGCKGRCWGRKLVNMASVVRSLRRFCKGSLLFKLGGSPHRMEMSDLRRRNVRVNQPGYVLVNGSDDEEAMVPRRSGNCSKKLLGACTKPMI
ncbi:hypothetical protein CTI12_AA029650 [Artemisia annua]|uniref:Uncharacterized protein n=1 Tax=Artemisia annua TaxID=35608 RepID=A0A2U1QDB9_ARTAN|nr:hypothetical protein CTI12_AA029650 [Artemisia annua]